MDSSSGSIYVAGDVFSSALDSHTKGGEYDIMLWRYDAWGVKQWTQQRGTAGNDFGHGGEPFYRSDLSPKYYFCYDVALFKVAVDSSSGSVYVIGTVSGALDGETFAGGSRDIALFQYDSSGVWQSTRLEGSMSGYDRGLGGE